MEKLQIASKILLSLALIYFSTAIIMFVIETGRTREAIPEILTDIGQLKLNAEIPIILRKVSEIIKEVSLVRQEIPSILKEVEAIRMAVPPILEEVEEIRMAIPPILKEVEEIRMAIPSILEEVAAVREELPQSLDKTQKIVTDAKEINVVGGVTKGVGQTAKGVVTAPFRLFGSDGDEAPENEEGKN